MALVGDMVSSTLALRRATAAIAAGRTEDDVLDALQAGMRDLVGDVPVEVVHGAGMVTSPPGATLVPLLSYGARRAGALVLGDESHPANEAVVAIAGVLGHLAAASLGQMQLQAEVVRRTVQLAELNDLSRQLNSAESVEAAIRAAATGAAALCGATDTGLYRLTEGMLALSAAGSDATKFPALLRVLDSNRRLLLGGNRGDPMVLGEGTLDGAPTLLLVLRLEGQSEGVLLLRGSKESAGWDDTELALADGLAEHLAVALRHINLLERTRKAAACDDLTGLASRQHFMGELAREIERVRRQFSPLSLLMVDADHFKAVNDTHGHAAGDEVLRELAACLKRGTRSLDVVGRLGGEEFGVLLPGTDEANAVVIAERLRRSVDALRIRHKDAEVRVTTSIGVAEWVPEWSFEDLLEAADEALYRSKADGRNRVTRSGALATIMG